MSNIMIDLETLSLRPNAYIATIAAVEFDLETGETGNHIHLGMAAYTYGYEAVDQDVVDWWLQQPMPAKQSLRKMLTENPHRLDLALEKLNRFISKHPNPKVWGNGASFEFPILVSAYRHFDITPAWEFWNERDTRTIVDTCRQITGIDPKKLTTFDGIPHTALADAIYQAKYVSKAFQLLKTAR